MNPAIVDRHARILFSCAAVFNFAAGLPILLAMPWMGRFIGMRPVPAEPLLAHLGGVLVLAFGWGYWRVSRDPVANRPIIHMGIVGKSLVVIAVFYDWAAGNTNWAFPLLVCADAVFAAWFADYLRRRPPGAVARLAMADGV
jgi:hypothetical protein